MNHPFAPGRPPRKAREFGFSIVEVILAGGLMAAIALALASLTTQQAKENRALTEKVANIELQRTLSAYFNSKLCTFALTDSSLASSRSSQIFDATSPTASIAFQSLPSGLSSGSSPLVRKDTLASPISVTASVSGIELRDFVGSGDVYVAKLVVSLDPTKLVRPLNPASLKVVVTTDPATPANAKKITGCGVAGTETPPLPYECRSVYKSAWTETLLFCGSAARIGVCTASHQTSGWDGPMDCPSPAVYADDPMQPVSCDAIVGANAWTEPLFACATATKVRLCTARYAAGAWATAFTCAGTYLAGTTNDPVHCSFADGAPGLTDPIFICRSPTHMTACTARYQAGAWTTPLSCIQTPSP